MSAPPKETVYYIKQHHFLTYEDGLKALNSQCKTLKRLQGKRENGFSFFMCLSTVNADLARKINLRDGLVGRPKIGFVNISKHQSSSLPHIHCYLGGLYAASAAREFAQIQCKQYYSKYPNTKVKKMPVIAQHRDDNKIPYEYIIDQASVVRFGYNKEILETFYQ